jgi:hypothetical protein
VDNIKILAVTWNMGSGYPSASDLHKIFQKDDVHHDLYVFGSQEAERSIAKSMVVSNKDKTNSSFEEYFQVNQDLGEFVIINSIALAATHMIIVCKKKYTPYISDIKNESLAVGTGDMLSNKGAVSISFKLGKTRLLFINCHLQAFDGQLSKRNLQWLEINRKFVLREEDNTFSELLCCAPSVNEKRVLPHL